MNIRQAWTTAKIVGISSAFILAFYIMARIEARQNAKGIEPTIGEIPGGSPVSRWQSDFREEMAKTPWVRDVSFSPGHINIGVLRGDKNWTSPMIASYLRTSAKRCGIPSEYYAIRIVDINMVVNQGKSINSSEIVKIER